jgi:arylsulfatase
VFVPAQVIVGEHLRTFQEFPPRQKPGSFSVDQAMEKLTEQKGDN